MNSDLIFDKILKVANLLQLKNGKPLIECIEEAKLILKKDLKENPIKEITSIQKVKDLVGFTYESLTNNKIDENISNKRFEICKNCIQLENEKCKLCGCIMKLKTQYSKAECPLDKW